jgi:hypothetical protein
MTAAESMATPAACIFRVDSGWMLSAAAAEADANRSSATTAAMNCDGGDPRAPMGPLSVEEDMTAPGVVHELKRVEIACDGT